jgi:hypothetical protein
MRQILTTLLILSSMPSFSQVRIFSGYIDKYPIQLVTFSYSDGITRAIYSYDKHDTPMIINGKQKNDSLFLIEYNDKGGAIFEFPMFKSTSKEIIGKWISQNKQTIYDIKLTKINQFDSYDSTSFDTLEFMQPYSINNHYFKLLITKKEGDVIRVTGVRIYEKETDRLIQQLNMDCEFWGLENISVGDYNFDGIDDFSVFESSYAGPNTSRIYVLRNPKAEKYFISEISGISLEFDPGAKLIYEHNQSCAGHSHMNATYKLIDNKMVLIEQKCLEYDDEKEDFIEKECN